MGARAVLAVDDEGVVACKSVSGETRTGFRGMREYADTRAQYSQRRVLPSEAAVMGAGVTAETALKASACPAPN